MHLAQELFAYFKAQKTWSTWSSLIYKQLHKWKLVRVANWNVLCDTTPSIFLIIPFIAKEYQELRPFSQQP